MFLQGCTVLDLSFCAELHPLSRTFTSGQAPRNDEYSGTLLTRKCTPLGPTVPA